MHIPDSFKKPLVQAGIASATFFVSGLGFGYLLGKFQSKSRLDDANVIIDEVMAWNEELRHKVEEIESIKTLRRKTLNIDLDALKDISTSEQVTTVIITEVENEEDEEPLINVITSDNDDDWDYEKELASRDPAGPYVIHFDEFEEDSMDFHQETLTYYAKDDVMTDIRDSPMYNHAGMMGDLLFGHGSRDPGVVYIRNEVLHMEWEIVLHEGSYTEEILGEHMEKQEEDELRHSVQKFRRE